MKVDEVHGVTWQDDVRLLDHAPFDEEEGPMPNIGLPELLMGLVIWGGSMILTAWVAGKKGYSPAVWVIIAFFFTLIALVVVLVLPRRTRAA
jgi:hypothetical protein